MTALEYLRKREWSMNGVGKGQCPDCYGVPQSWLGHPCYLKAARLGHQRNCELAAALASEGECPLYIGAATGPEFEVCYVTDPSGLNPGMRFMSTRKKP